MSNQNAYSPEGQPLEIERKYLIRFPDLPGLLATYDCSRLEITQVYLRGKVRIRETIENGRAVYHRTEKRDISNVTRIENEQEIITVFQFGTHGLASFQAWLVSVCSDFAVKKSWRW